MQSNNNSDNPRDALIVTQGLPVAVKDLTTLTAEIGIPQKIKFSGNNVAYRLTEIKHPAFKEHFGTDDHIWIDPSITSYATAWKKSGCYSPEGKFHLDHLHAKARAEEEGYGLVLLYPCPVGANLSAGAKEGALKRNATKNLADSQPIYYAEGIHFCKMWGCYQHLRQDLSNTEIDKLILQYRDSKR